MLVWQNGQYLSFISPIIILFAIIGMTIIYWLTILPSHISFMVCLFCHLCVCEVWWREVHRPATSEAFRAAATTAVPAGGRWE